MAWGWDRLRLVNWPAAGAAQAAADPLALKRPPIRARAKNVIFLFMAGAPSHLELFDNKPQLAKFDGTLPPPELLKGYRAAFINPNSKLLGPKFKFAKHGQSGAELSELLPHLAEVADDIAIVKSMVTDAFNHAPGQILMSTGSQQFGKPSLGAWTLYGLGSETQNLPGFVVFSTGKKGPSGGNSNWGSGYLPTVYQGVTFRTSGDPVLYLSNPSGVDDKLQRESLDAVNALNREHLSEVGDPEIATRINSFEMAYRMQAQAPEAIDISKEPEHVLKMYGAEPGKPSFAATCLLARRLVERGVRFVEIFHEAWDQHGNLVNDIRRQLPAHRPGVRGLGERSQAARAVGRHARHLGRRVWPHADGAGGRQRRPRPSPERFTMWLAGGGVKPGVTLGESDDFGFNATKDRVHVHDLHATILHLLGFDPMRFAYKFQGLDQRLIGVEPARGERNLGLRLDDESNVAE